MFHKLKNIILVEHFRVIVFKNRIRPIESLTTVDETCDLGAFQPRLPPNCFHQIRRFEKRLCQVKNGDGNRRSYQTYPTVKKPPTWNWVWNMAIYRDESRNLVWVLEKKICPPYCVTSLRPFAHFVPTWLKKNRFIRRILICRSVLIFFHQICFCGSLNWIFWSLFLHLRT